MSKGYTINYFVNLISDLKETELKKDIYKAIAPRGGYNSERAIRLEDWVGGEETFREIAAGKTARTKALGKTTRARILKALKTRKAKGKVF